MPNRQQRRHPAPTPLIAGQNGQSWKPVDPPEKAGDLTVNEINEIRARDGEITYLSEQLQHLNRVLLLVRGERGSFIRTICRDHGLAVEAEYNVDLENGHIWKVAEPVAELTPELEVVKE